MRGGERMLLTLEERLERSARSQAASRRQPSGGDAGGHPQTLHGRLAGVRPSGSHPPLHRRPVLLSGAGGSRENPPRGRDGQSPAFPGSPLPMRLRSGGTGAGGAGQTIPGSKRVLFHPGLRVPGKPARSRR